MKRLSVYLAVAFGLAWGLLIPAGFALGTFQAGENSLALMVVGAVCWLRLKQGNEKGRPIKKATRSLNGGMYET